MSKKQQKIQNPEYTLGHFLSKEEKEKFNEINHRANKDKKSVVQKNKTEKNKLSNISTKPLIKKVNSEKKLINSKEKEHKINKMPSSDNINIKNKTFNENLILDEKNIIKEDIINENENENIKEASEKKRSQLKLLKKKHKRMNKYKKAIVKFRLAKKRAFCEAVQKDNEQLFFSNTFNADESINNVINNVLNQNINTEENVNNNNTNNTYNEYSYNLSMISENKMQDKSPKNNEINLSNKFSPILSQRKVESNNNNNVTNSFLNYYTNNHESNNITMNSFNKDDISSKNNISENINNINTPNISNTYFPPNSQNNNNLNNNYLPNNNDYYIYNYPNTYNNRNIYINNNLYNYCYYMPPFAPFQNNNYDNYNYYYNNNNYANNISNINNNSNNNNFYYNNNISMNNTLPLPKTVNQEFPSVKAKLKKEKKKDKKLSNYIKNLKTESNCLSSLNLDTMNGKELTSLIKENKDIDKIDLNLINELLPEEEANSFVKKYAGVSKADNSKNNSNSNNTKPIREYVDQILDKNFEKIFSDFIIKLRDVYYKKKSIAPLKAKKRIVLGMREIEKNIKLKNILLVFVVPYIEKVDGIKNSMDQRIIDIFNNCRKNEIPIFFGLNKFKLGQIARKKISAISMLGIINVEGMENELKNIIKIGNELKKKWYLDNYVKKENFKDNKFINQDNFEYFHNMYLAEEINKNKENENEKQK